ncbi:MAG: HAMP domain-containing protein, partial [Rhodospirillales bacterium]|nr:HAMP domain-containing protein [Rhodospirillales bacterium]
MATGNGSASNQVADAIRSAEESMAVILAQPLPEKLHADARMVATVGSGMATAAQELIERSRRLDQMVAEDVEVASRHLQQTIETVAQAFTARVESAARVAAEARAAAQREMLVLIAGIAVVLVVLGGITTQIISRPLRGLTHAVQRIAAGETDQPVGYVGWREEVGQMAAAVETLRGVMRQTFVQSQMIEQIPVGVMMTDADTAARITFMNAEAHKLMALVADALPLPPAAVVGASFRMFDPPGGEATAAEAPARPLRRRLALGQETFELRISAILDRAGAQAGHMVIWRRVTEQLQLAHTFEQSVGTIARSLEEAAGAMTGVARGMSGAAEQAGRSTIAVSSAA